MKISSLILLSLLPVAFSQKPVSTASNNPEENVRVKRAGFSLIGGAIQNLQKSAFSASASLAAGSSTSSAGSSSSPSSSSSSHSNVHENDYHSHSYSHGDDHGDHHHEDTKSFDGWQLKKSILNTLLQAVKAIAGGVTTLKGQLIKGSGYVVSQKGKLISAAGESVSDAGRNIVKSAQLIQPESSGHGSPSIGYSLGSKFGGLSSGISGGITKTISGLSAGSSGSVSSLSSSSSSSSSSHGHEDYNVHTHNYESHTPVDGPSYYSVPLSSGHSSHDSYGPPKIIESYGPPKTIESYGPPKTHSSYIQAPHSTYGAPEYHDESYKSNQEAEDVLSEILKNLPHKPMKSTGYDQYSDGHSFSQLPIPDDIAPPPFKPLSSSSHVPYESTQYGPPPSNHYTDYSYQPSLKKVVLVNPKAYDTYHTMRLRSTKEKNFVTIPTLTDAKGLEVQKSIAYELKA